MGNFECLEEFRNARKCAAIIEVLFYCRFRKKQNERRNENYVDRWLRLRIPFREQKRLSLLHPHLDSRNTGNDLYKTRILNQSSNQLIIHGSFWFDVFDRLNFILIRTKRSLHFAPSPTARSCDVEHEINCFYSRSKRSRKANRKNFVPTTFGLHELFRSPTHEVSSRLWVLLRHSKVSRFLVCCLYQFRETLERRSRRCPRRSRLVKSFLHDSYSETKS